ncbi:MAG: toprim domain-containing protein [Bilophila wadsworthia]
MEKKGNFHTIAAEGKDFSQGEILICEGYATGASLHMATEKPVAVALDSGNLEPVAKALREKFPQAQITICADNDPRSNGTATHNMGMEKPKPPPSRGGSGVQ